MQRTKPSSKNKSSADKLPPTWTAAEKKDIQKFINRVNPDKPIRNHPLNWIHSEGDMLLCMSPDEVYDRVSALLTNCAIVSGLILSAIAGSALEPLDASEYPEDRQLTVELFNVITPLTTMTQAAVTLYSTFCLCIVAKPLKHGLSLAL